MNTISIRTHAAAVEATDLGCLVVLANRSCSFCGVGQKYQSSATAISEMSRPVLIEKLMGIDA